MIVITQGLLGRLVITQGYGTGQPAAPSIDNRNAPGISNATRAFTGNTNSTRALAGRLPNT